MTYGMTKEQLIAANTELIKAVQAKDQIIRELEAELRNREKLPPTRRTHGYIVQRDAAIARAERAEADLRIERENRTRSDARYEARVAELEKGPCFNPRHGRVPHDHPLEAREREASPLDAEQERLHTRKRTNDADFPP